MERIYTKLLNKAHFTPVHILLYTMPGIPSIYYGSEFAIEGRKEKSSDASLRPALELGDFKDAVKNNPATRLIAALGKVRSRTPELSYGDYRELLLTNRQYAFSRNHNGRSVIVTVNNDDGSYTMTLPAGNAPSYMGALSGECVNVSGGNIQVTIQGNSGEIWVPVENGQKREPAGAVEVIVSGISVKSAGSQKKPEDKEKTGQNGAGAEAGAACESKEGDKKEPEKKGAETDDRTYQEGMIAGLQEAIIAIMEKNGPVTDQMRRDVYNNTHHDSLITWIKSFR